MKSAEIIHDDIILENLVVNVNQSIDNPFCYKYLAWKYFKYLQNHIAAE